MSNLSKVLERFKADIKSLAKIKKEKEAAKTAYDKKRTELDRLGEAEIKAQGKKVALANIADLKSKQNDFRKKNNEYADTLLKIQGEFEETYSTVLHSLVDTVYDARKMMHYLNAVKDHNDSDFVNDRAAIGRYLQAYTSAAKFDEPTIKRLIDETKKLTKYLNSNERKKLMNAFARHEKEDLKNLLTFVQKKRELEQILEGLDLNEKVDKLPTSDEIVTNYARFLPQIYDAEGNEELSMNDVLNIAYSAFFEEESAEKEVKYEYNFEIELVIPLYADPIIVVSFDFKLSFEFKAVAAAKASVKGSIKEVSLEAKCSVSFGVSAALSLTVVQIIKASINAGIFFDTSIGAEAKLKSQIAYLSGEAGLKAESKLIAKTWISLSICGPLLVIIEAATGKKPELRWMMGELALFKLVMEKKAELKLDPMKNEFKAEANFRPYRDGFTVEFIGKEEIKRKLNEKYNNKLAVIKQQFLSNDEMRAAHDDKMALLRKFDVLDIDAGAGNDNFKKKVQHRTSFIMRYDSYYNNFMGKIVESLHPNPEEFQKTSILVNTFASELKKKYHSLFITANDHVKDNFNNFEIKDAQDDVWLNDEPTLMRVLAEDHPQLIEEMKTGLGRIESNQKDADKLISLGIIDLEYVNNNANIKFKKVNKLIDKTKEMAKAYIEELLIGDIGTKDCVFGFSTIEIFPTKRKQKHEARADLTASIDGLLKDQKGDLLALSNPDVKIKAKLKTEAIKLKAEFDKRKTDEVRKDYHKILEKQTEEVIEYFERISSDLDLQVLKPIEKGIEKLKEFNQKNVKRKEYIFPSKSEIMELYKGTNNFKALVLSKIAEEYAAQMAVIAELNISIDLFDWFEKDDSQQKLGELMENIDTLHDFIENHPGVSLEQKRTLRSDITFKDYIEKTPDEMSKELEKVLQKSTSR